MTVTKRPRQDPHHRMVALFTLLMTLPQRKTKIRQILCRLKQGASVHALVCFLVRWLPSQGRRWFLRSLKVCMGSNPTGKSVNRYVRKLIMASFRTRGFSALLVVLLKVGTIWNKSNSPPRWSQSSKTSLMNMVSNSGSNHLTSLPPVRMVVSFRQYQMPSRLINSRNRVPNSPHWINTSSRLTNILRMLGVQDQERNFSRRLQKVSNS